MTDLRPLPKALRLPKKRTTPLESQIEAKVCRYARDLGYLVYKFVSPNYRSVPDRMLIRPGGGVFFIEFKSAGKKPTDAQEREIKRLRDQGCRVFVVDNVEDGKHIVKALQR